MCVEYLACAGIDLSRRALSEVADKTFSYERRLSRKQLDMAPKQVTSKVKPADTAALTPNFSIRVKRSSGHRRRARPAVV